MGMDTWPLDYDYPVELNRYVYAAANPVTYSDPSGYFADYLGALQVSNQNSDETAALGAGTKRLVSPGAGATFSSLIVTP